MLKLLHGLGRRIVAGALVYALVLQGFVFAAEIAQAANAAAGAAGFELCTHSGGATLPQTPVSPGDNHCPFCLAGLAVYLDAAPAAGQHAVVFAFAGAPWPPAAANPIAFFVNESAWPRGPPSAV
jgi:hypothetical protein